VQDLVQQPVLGQAVQEVGTETGQPADQVVLRQFRACRSTDALVCGLQPRCAMSPIGRFSAWLAARYWPGALAVMAKATAGAPNHSPLPGPALTPPSIARLSHA
jgi:hypothetical protein